VGRILVDTRVPDGVELHGTELAWRLENAHPARVSKLGDKSGRDGTNSNQRFRGLTKRLAPFRGQMANGAHGVFVGTLN
jgi:hypothetical protein